MIDYFLVKNLYNYEKVIPPPPNLPKNLKTVYITDTDENQHKATQLGWDIVKKTDMFLNIVDNFERRKSVAFINSFPLKVVPEMLEVRFIFICDSNIVTLWNQYNDFVNSCSEDFALFVTSGYYKGLRDNILSECDDSIRSTRWSYNHKEIKKCTDGYIDDLKLKNIDINKLSVVSAKYIGWNPSHKQYEKISNKLYEEYCTNLQGNIILTYMSAIYPKDIFNFFTNDYSGSNLNQHNFSA